MDNEVFEFEFKCSILSEYQIIPTDILKNNKDFPFICTIMCGGILG